MKVLVKKLKCFMSDIWRSVSVYLSFYKRHKKIKRNLGCSYLKLTKEEKKEYLSYWRGITPFISLKTVEITKSFTESYSKYIVPEEVYALKIEPLLNSRAEVSFLKNKSFYNKWFVGESFPKCYLFSIDGLLYDALYKPIENPQKFMLENVKYPAVFKPSIDTYGGQGVVFVSNEKELLSLLNTTKDYVVQEKICQSSEINEYSKGICTIRVCLYRNKLSYGFNVINCSLRMGVNGSLDNETSGGIVCNISANGIFNEFAINKYGIKFLRHPDTGFVFKGEKLPYYKKLLEQSVLVANQVPYTQLISLDMCLDYNNDWRCIEMTMFGQTIRFAQYAGQPFFGEFTQEILSTLTLRE
ncbi:sugar-transfer associated ATP-grasp domain-containing protein [Paenalcaligenes sp.]|uniref:sugar-transfer associated ATP-grasp domain-containing protein n=1 Tax=Paenalcaligenes sp. TaxID=1966342 RepID=UPI00261E9855|nr:sugar-transfer associated ATP-grasp domain-containing protein [Paenalcaligenes sp.]